MSAVEEYANSDVRVVWAGEVDIATVSELAERAYEAVAEPSATGVVLDLRDVSFIDSTGVSVLLSVRRSSLALGMSFKVLPSPRVERVIDLMGLKAELVT